MADELDKAWVRIGKAPASRAKTAILKLAKSRNPRIATLYLSWLEQGYWPAPTAKIVWERIFSHLVALQNGSVAEPLRAVAETLPPFVGEAHRAWMTSQIRATAAALPKVRNAKPAAHAPAKPAADPLAPVWKAPDDDELRQVVADLLGERGDPRGELITLQLLATPDAKQRSRARALLDEHAVAWLGAIAKLTLGGSSLFERGFPVTVALDRRAVPRREWEAALAAPQWATIRTLRVSILHTPKWWITAWVKHPNNRALAFEVGDLKTKRPGMGIERAPGKPWHLASAIRGNASVCVPILSAFVAGLPRGQSMTIAADVPERTAYAAVLP